MTSVGVGVNVGVRVGPGVEVLVGVGVAAGLTPHVVPLSVLRLNKISVLPVCLSFHTR